MRTRKQIVFPAAALITATGLGLGLMAMGPAPARPAAAATAAAATYTADRVHSSVVFNIMHAGAARFWGYFSDVSGQFTLDGDNSSFSFEIPVEKVYTGNADRDQHLKSADFFNAAQFKTISFKSTQVEASGSDTYSVTGDLTMLGETKPVTAEIKKTGEGSFRNSTVVGLEAQFTIKRSEWGMSTMVNRGLGDDVTVIVSVEGRQQ